LAAGRADRTRVPQRVLQNHNCVAALQLRRSYSVVMSLPANEQSDEAEASARRVPSRLRARALPHRAGLGVAALSGICVLPACCGGGLSHPGVASLGTSAVTTTGPLALPSGNNAGPSSTALAFIGRMRKHGEPSMPEPEISNNRPHLSININASSGPNRSSPQLFAATVACTHLSSSNAVTSAGQTITPAGQADHLEAVVCMRSHGFPDLPDPPSQNSNVTFNNSSKTGTISSQLKSAPTTCEKPIPAGVTSSSPGGWLADPAVVWHQSLRRTSPNRS
jgi:hypothetical protein